MTLCALQAIHDVVATPFHDLSYELTKEESAMTPNVGKTDRIIRVVAGLAIVGVGIAYGTWWGAVRIVPLGTALIRWCPPYTLLGISTCSVEPAEGDPASTEG